MLRTTGYLVNLPTSVAIEVGVFFGSYPAVKATAAFLSSLCNGSEGKSRDLRPRHVLGVLAAVDEDQDPRVALAEIGAALELMDKHFHRRNPTGRPSWGGPQAGDGLPTA